MVQNTKSEAQDSNLQHPDSRSGTLPIELTSDLVFLVPNSGNAPLYPPYQNGVLLLN